MLSKFIKYIGGIAICFGLFFVVNQTYAQFVGTGNCPPNQPTIEVSGLEGSAPNYTYSSTPKTFTVTVHFPMFGYANTSNLPEKEGFTHDNPSITKDTPVHYTIISGTTATLDISILKGVVMSYPLISGSPCDNSPSDKTTISYKAPGSAGAVEGPAESPCSPTTGEAREMCSSNGTRVCDPRNKQDHCCGISLLTDVPFIGKCIVMVSDAELKSIGITDPSTIAVSQSTAFPRLMLGLTKILVTVILLASFIAIIVAGVMMAASGDKEEGYSKGTALIGSVIAALALLGASGVILRLINPNFFG